MGGLYLHTLHAGFRCDRGGEDRQDTVRPFLEKARKILSSIDREEIEGEVRVYKLRYLSVKDAVRLLSPLSSVVSKRFGTPMVVSSSEGGWIRFRLGGCE